NVWTFATIAGADQLAAAPHPKSGAAVANNRRPTRPPDRRRPDSRDRSGTRGSWSLLLVVGAVALVVVLGMLASHQRTKPATGSGAPADAPVSVSSAEDGAGQPSSTWSDVPRTIHWP